VPELTTVAALVLVAAGLALEVRLVPLDGRLVDRVVLGTAAGVDDGAGRTRAGAWPAAGFATRVGPGGVLAGQDQPYGRRQVRADRSEGGTSDVKAIEVFRASL
jgi:hypothetical protein